MKISKVTRAKILADMLPRLVEAVEPKVVFELVKGEQIIAKGQTHFENGQCVIPDRLYHERHTQEVKVDHKRRIETIMKSASTYDAMTTGLSQYLTTWGRDFIERRKALEEQEAKNESKPSL